MQGAGVQGEFSLAPMLLSSPVPPGAHLVGVASVMEENETLDPLEVSVFGADGVVFEVDGIAHPIQQFLGWHGKSPGKALTLRQVGSILLVYPARAISGIGTSGDY